MENEKLERVLRTVDPARRLFLKRFLLGATFAVPIVASYSVKNVAYAGTTNGTTTVTEPCTEFVTTTVFKTVTATVTETIN
jgi:hypothetical protein